MEKREVVGEDGLLHCTVCGERTEREIDMPLLDGNGGSKKVKVHCVCRCEREAREAREQRMRYEEERRQIDSLKRLSLLDAKSKDVYFKTYQVKQENQKVLASPRDMLKISTRCIRRARDCCFGEMSEPEKVILPPP